MSIDEVLNDNPDYIEDVEKMLEYQAENKKPDHVYIEDTEFDSFWTFKDVSIKPQKLYQIEMSGIIERVFDTNSKTCYTLSDYEGARSFIGKRKDQTGEDGTLKKEYTFPDEDELPENLFEDVIGYEDVKWLLKRALTTDDIVNVLLVGPPGSAKTVFLLCIKDLKDSMFVSGSTASGPGVLDVMFKNKPMNMCIDEFDDTPKETQEALSQHMDTGILDETKMGKDRKLKINTNTFASANSTDPVIDQVESRFLDIHFDPYTKEEFIEICEHLLPRREGSDKEESRYIAESVWSMEEAGDVRKAIAVARLSRGDPEKIVEVLEEYSPSGIMGGF